MRRQGMEIDVLERILGHVAGANRTPKYNYANPKEPPRDESGEIIYEWHFFCRWLAGLQDGSFGLPPKVPRQLLESFDDATGPSCSVAAIVVAAAAMPKSSRRVPSVGASWNE
jgi:hypothetical protein